MSQDTDLPTTMRLMDARLVRQAQFREHGIAIITHALDAGDLDHFAALMPRSEADAPAVRLPCDALARLATNAQLNALATDMSAALPVSGPTSSAKPPHLIRAIAVDRKPPANWFVPWHQDLERESVSATALAGPAKSNRPPCSCATPEDVLERIVTLRVHLDECDETSGPLEVVLGSHRYGVLGQEGVRDLVATGTTRLCLADRGDVMVLSPLTVQRTQRSIRPTSPSRRRVLHLEYLAVDQPPGAKRQPLAAGTC